MDNGTFTQLSKVATMKSILISSLVTAASAGAVFQPADPTITPGPRVNYELFRKQDNNRFIGFISQSSGYTALSCSVGDRVWETNSLWGLVLSKIHSEWIKVQGTDLDVDVVQPLLQVAKPR